jgi:hypothetical protein
MFQAKVLEKIRTHVLYPVTFYEDRAVYGMMWKTLYSRASHMTIWRMRVACSITKAINTHLLHVELIAFSV